MVRRIIIIVGIVFIILIGIVMHHGSSCKITTQSIEPLNMSLFYLQGPDDGSSCVSVGIFSKMLKQEEIDSQIENSYGKDKAGQCTDKLCVKIGKSEWKNKVVFWKLDGAGAKEKIQKGIKLVSYQADGQLLFRADSFYNAIYKIENSSMPKQGDKIYAELTFGKYKAVSNVVTMPVKRSGKYENLVRKAEVCIFLCDYKELMSTADKIISTKGDSYLGYWYKGLALESKEDYNSALESMNTALRKYRQSSTSNILREPPVWLVDKIRELKKILG